MYKSTDFSCDIRTHGNATSIIGSHIAEFGNLYSALNLISMTVSADCVCTVDMPFKKMEKVGHP